VLKTDYKCTKKYQDNEYTAAKILQRAEIKTNERPKSWRGTARKVRRRCETGYFTLRNSLFRALKEPVSHLETASFKARQETS